MAMSDAQEYDPFAAFDDVVAGTTRDPYPGLADKRRTTPVSKGYTMPPEVLPEGFNPEPEWIAYRYDDCSRILARRQDLHLDRLRRDHRHGDGPHDPGHGRPRAPQPPEPGGPRLP